VQTCFFLWPCRAFPRVAQLSTLLKRRKDQIVRKKASLNLSKKKEEKGHKRRNETACFVELTIKVATTYHYSEEEME